MESRQAPSTLLHHPLIVGMCYRVGALSHKRTRSREMEGDRARFQRMTLSWPLSTKIVAVVGKYVIRKKIWKARFRAFWRALKAPSESLITWDLLTPIKLWLLQSIFNSGNWAIYCKVQDFLPHRSPRAYDGLFILAGVIESRRLERECACVSALWGVGFFRQCWEGQGFPEDLQYS